MIEDPFTKEIIRSYLSSTVDEMVTTTARAAYSPTLSEGLDFSCAIFDPSGHMVAQAAGIGVHLGVLQPVLRKMLAHYESIEEGDVLLTNDPYTATHHPDVVVARPMYYQSTKIGFAMNIGHWTDIGGAAAGGCAGTTTHVIQDGLIIPICKLYRQGELVPEVRDFILGNIRSASAAWGDVQSQIAACRTAEDRMRALVARYGLAVVMSGMHHAIQYSRDRFLTKMSVIPDGVYVAEDYIDDDGISEQEYTIKTRIEKNSQGFVVDFEGSSQQAPTPINSNYSTTCAAVYSGLLAVVDPFTPANEGVFNLIDVRAPVGTITNAQWPASTFGSTFEVTKRMGELMFRALASSVPDRVEAGGFCSGNNMGARCVSDDGKQENMWYYFVEGGQGARMHNDGNSAVYHWHGTATNQPVEVWEHRYPILYRKYALIPDSGGPGVHRGGLGTVRHIECLWDHYISAISDRHRIPPWGLQKGHDGRPNSWGVIRDGVEQTMKQAFRLVSNSKFYNLLIRKGDVIVMESGGGGGFGDPAMRERSRVRHDLREGYISTKSARENYGLDEEGCTDA